VTYLTADPLLTPRTLLKALRPTRGGRWPDLPEQTLYFESGRVALWAALRALELGPGDRLVVPAYICDSILPALTALRVEVRYVGVDLALRPDLEAVERELARGAGAVLAVHFYGFLAPGFGELAALCERYGAALIEDCAHGLFSQPDGRALGSVGQAAIFSPRKSVALPDGGALVLNGIGPPSGLGALSRPPTLTTLQRLVYRALPTVETALGFSPRLWLLRSWLLRRRLQRRLAEQTLVPRRASGLSRALLRGTDARRVVDLRRENYRRLLAALRGLTWARPLFDRLPSGVCPLGLPILAADRELARRRLLGAGVNVRAYWEQLPTAVTAAAFPQAHQLARQILVLPVHQSLTPRQVDQLIQIVVDLESLPWPSAS
jgi:perosamine synthetase